MSRLDADLCARLSKIRCFLLDLDGTTTIGETMLDGAALFFEHLGTRDFIFLTNNSSHGAGHYVDRMNRLGINMDHRQVLTSTDALIRYLGIIMPDKQPSVFAVGTPDFERDLQQAGFKLVQKPEQLADYVVLGFDTTLTYEKLDRACDLIRRGVPYLAANPDLVCPLAGGRVLPDCGSIIAFMTACTGKPPVRIVGKPEPDMSKMVMEQYGYRPEELAMVGDRLYTDIEFAKRAGIMGIAVLSGETTQDEIEQSVFKPDLVLQGLGDLGRLLDQLSST